MQVAPGGGGGMRPSPATGVPAIAEPASMVVERSATTTDVRVRKAIGIIGRSFQDWKFGGKPGSSAGEPLDIGQVEPGPRHVVPAIAERIAREDLLRVLVSTYAPR